MNDTIAAISTAQGVGAIAIIRVSGSRAIEIVDSIFSNKNMKFADTHTIHYGYILDDSEIIDEVLVSLMRAPKSFTTEDVVEINSHGGISTTNKILELLLVKGARLALPGEFSKRAFLNGRIDLTEAEGIIDLINSKTDISRKIALNQLNGKANDMIRKLRDELVQIISNIEVNIDYPEYEDIEEVTTHKIKKNLFEIENKLKKIINQSKSGEILVNGIKTVIVGRPNVGKSSLLNRLIGEEKAIVTDVKGTTRDSVEAILTIDNIILNLIDTAGIHDTDDIVESIGVDKSLQLIDQADLILFVVNFNEKLNEDDYKIIDKLDGKNYITIVNKIDLEKKIDYTNLKNVVFVSALNDDNIDEIGCKIKKMFGLEKIETGDLTYLTSARSQALLKKVLVGVSDIKNGIDSNSPIDMIEIDLKNIWNLLGEIIGETYNEELLDQLFSRFCVGK